ncbi:hypothetical protein BG910_00240 [Neisseria chenwenguii]|uniref:Uncharacterized protein n=1 Tax=Neisseria chenwenguii TaxID=1853278 RepID=A0A220RYU5_9NEIS|nr:hypothetical protein BG910_00240 [Neisseria chenwenguii]
MRKHSSETARVQTVFRFFAVLLRRVGNGVFRRPFKMIKAGAVRPLKQADFETSNFQTACQPSPPCRLKNLMIESPRQSNVK